MPHAAAPAPTAPSFTPLHTTGVLLSDA